MYATSNPNPFSCSSFPAAAASRWPFSDRGQSYLHHTRREIYIYDTRSPTARGELAHIDNTSIMISQEIIPASELVLLVPGGFSVSDQHEGMLALREALGAARRSKQTSSGSRKHGYGDDKQMTGYNSFLMLELQSGNRFSFSEM